MRGEQEKPYTLLTALNNVGSVANICVSMRTTAKNPHGFVTTHGVLMVKPRTAGMRETRVAAATENFMACAKGR